MKHLLFISLLLVAFQSSSAQSWEWSRKINGLGDVHSNNITTDSDGNFIVTGTYETDTLLIDSIKLANEGSKDLFIAKFNPDGNVIWAKKAGGSGLEFITGICTDSLNSIYVIGYYFSGPISFSGTSLDIDISTDMFITKYDSIGNVEWAISPSGDASVIPYGITCDYSGDLLVTGEFNYDNLTFGSITLNDIGFNSFVLKLNNQGVAQWGVVNNIQFIGDIATDSANNIYVVGSFYGNIAVGDDSLINAVSSGTSDMCLIKYDPNGNPIWALNEGGTESDGARNLAVDNEGNIYVGGYYYSTTMQINQTTFSGNAYGDIFIAKYDTDGNNQWAKKGSSTDKDVLTDIDVDHQGNLYVTGYFEGPSIAFGNKSTTNTNAGKRDGFITRLNTDGGTYYVQRQGGIEHDESNDVAVDKFGNAYITGTYRSSSVTVGGVQLSSPESGAFDVFLTKIETPFLQIEDDNKLESVVSIYPNPINYQSTLRFDLKPNEHFNINFYDSQGSIVETFGNISTNTIIIDRAKFSPGIYYYRLSTTKGRNSTGKLIAQ